MKKIGKRRFHPISQVLYLTAVSLSVEGFF